MIAFAGKVLYFISHQEMSTSKFRCTHTHLPFPKIKGNHHQQVLHRMGMHAKMQKELESGIVQCVVHRLHVRTDKSLLHDTQTSFKCKGDSSNDKSNHKAKENQSDMLKLQRSFWRVFKRLPNLQGLHRHAIPDKLVVEPHVDNLKG